MAFMDWSDSLSVQVKEIDEQHKRLVQMVNRLHEAMMKKQGRLVVGGIISELADYTVYHFATEEKYMRLYKYPGTDEHLIEHKQFVQKVSAFKQDYDSGKLGVTIEVLNFLNKWLVTHISGTDKKFGPFFNGKGLT